MPARRKFKKFKKFSRFGLSKRSAIILIAIFAAIGGIYVWRSFAAAAETVKVVGIARASNNDAYWIVDSSGAVQAFGGAPSFSPGSVTDAQRTAPISGIVAHRTSSGADGYWLFGRDGHVYAFGAAKSFGDPLSWGQKIDAPISSMTATNDNGGYWLLESNGLILTYGNAVSYNYSYGQASPTGDGTHYNYADYIKNCYVPAVGIWWVAIDASSINSYLSVCGNAFSMYWSKDAPWEFPTPQKGNVPAVVAAVEISPVNGHWLALRDGTVYNYGDTASFATGHGPITNRDGDIVGMVRTANGKGYWEVSAKGTIYIFGNAINSGSFQLTNRTISSTVTNISGTPPPSSSTGGTSSSGSSGSSGGSSGSSSGGSGVSITGTKCPSDGIQAICDLQANLNGAGEKLTVDGKPGPHTAQACSDHPTFEHCVPALLTHCKDDSYLKRYPTPDAATQQKCDTGSTSGGGGSGGSGSGGGQSPTISLSGSYRLVNVKATARRYSQDGVGAPSSGNESLKLCFAGISKQDHQKVTLYVGYTTPTISNQNDKVVLNIFTDLWLHKGINSSSDNCQHLFIAGYYRVINFVFTAHPSDGVAGITNVVASSDHNDFDFSLTPYDWY